MPRAPLLRTSLLLPLGVVVLGLAFWSPFLREGLRLEDFPGHVALVRVLSDIVAADPSLPLWNGREYAGASLVIAYLHPIGSLALLSPFTGLLGAETGLRVGGVAYLLLAGLAMYAWCLAWGRSRPGATLGALVYVLSPAVFGYVGAAGQMHQPVTLAVVPLVFLAWMRLGSEPRLSCVVVTAVASALLLLDMQRFFIAMPFALVVYLSTCLSRPPGGGSRLGVGALFASGAFLGVFLLACFPVLPVLDERSQLQWHAPEAIEVWRQRFSFAHALQLVDRAGFLSSSLAGIPAARTPASAGQWYQGSVVLAFALVGSVLVARGPKDAARNLRLAVTFGCWALVVALAFGPRAIFVHHLEIARQLLGAGPTGFALLVLLLLVLAGWVASLWWLRVALRDRWPSRSGLVDGCVAALALLVGCVAPFEILSRVVFVYDHIRGPAHFAFPMLGFLLGSAVCLVMPGWERALRRPSRVAALAVVFVGLHAVDVLPYRAAIGARVPEPVASALRQAFASLRGGADGRILDVSGYSPLADALGAVESQRRSAWGWLAWTSMRHTSELLIAGVARQIASGNLEAAAQIAGLANVRFLSRIAYTGGRLEPSDALSDVVRSRYVTIAENLRALPDAQLYSELAWVSGPNPERIPLVAKLARAGIASYTLDPLATDAPPSRTPDFVSGDEARRRAPGAHRLPTALPPRDVASGCRAERPRDVEIRVACEISEPGLLVVAESWSPRWRVEVDGTPRPLLRLNHAFQGVEVAAGDRAMRFFYQPSWVTRVALGISSLSWIAALAYGAARRRRRPG